MKVCFCWIGFPQYAARCVGAFVRATGIETVVVAIPPEVPAVGMEDVCGCKVVWVDRACRRLTDLPELSGVTHLFVSGWFLPQFNAVSRMVRRRGGKVIAVLDNDAPVMASIGARVRALLKRLHFRCSVVRMFDGYFVPGKSSRRLLSGYGVAPDRIWEGCYCADETLYRDGAPLSERQRRILYVGQYIPRKNVLAMVDAFRAERREGWQLDLYGCGPLTIPSGDGVSAHDFLQVGELSAKYREARAFWLGSHEEHWGLVVHEAALSGCLLALSRRVGAAEDLAGTDNAVLFSPDDPSDMRRAMRTIMTLDDASLARAQRESTRLASRFALDTFVSAVKDMLARA